MKNILEDLEILILQNEDDFDRGSGKFILRNFIKEKQAKQLTLTDVSQQRELLPEFLMKDSDGKIVTAYIGGADVTKEWNEYLGNCG
jgi:hypothetical protein